jgi:hypothetical protein
LIIEKRKNTPKNMYQAAFEIIFKITCVAAFGQFLESSQNYLEAGTIFLRRYQKEFSKLISVS